MESSTINNQQNTQENLQTNKLEQELFGEQWLAHSLKKAYVAKDVKCIKSFNLIDPRILKQPSLKKAFLWVIDNTCGFSNKFLISGDFNEQMRVLRSLYRKPVHVKEAYK